MVGSRKIHFAFPATHYLIPTTCMTPEDFMRQAIALATENARSGRGGPFAALVVREQKIIAEGSNLVTSANDPTAHAEVIAIRRACATLKDFQLRSCEIYCSAEPCPMCLAAIYWSRAERIYFGASRQDAAAIGFDDVRIYREVALPVEQRALPAQQLLREESLESFREWEKKPDKKM